MNVCIKKKGQGIIKVSRMRHTPRNIWTNVDLIGAILFRDVVWWIRNSPEPLQSQIQHLTPWLTWAGPPDTVSVERSRPQPRPWSLCRRRTASLSCPTRPGWAWPPFYSVERDPTLLVNPPFGRADTKGTTADDTTLYRQCNTVAKHSVHI